MQTIHISRIVDVTRERIIFRDEQGHIASIELEPCADRYAAAHPETDLSGKSIRCVGVRCFGEYAYYEFCAEEPIRFYLNLKTSRMQKIITRLTGWNFHTKAFEQFYSVQKRLNSAGWTTLDLT